mmetsp:Transcript_42500/g.120229  ORF Transcript_42500/g.120229 Transcript_42500/m.120229 type:complete len:407 (-) Transcript_42500:887-2107(-)
MLNQWSAIPGQLRGRVRHGRKLLRLGGCQAPCRHRHGAAAAEHRARDARASGTGRAPVQIKLAHLHDPLPVLNAHPGDLFHCLLNIFHRFLPHGLDIHYLRYWDRSLLDEWCLWHLHDHLSRLSDDPRHGLFYNLCLRCDDLRDGVHVLHLQELHRLLLPDDHGHLFNPLLGLDANYLWDLPRDDFLPGDWDLGEVLNSLNLGDFDDVLVLEYGWDVHHVLRNLKHVSWHLFCHCLHACPWHVSENFSPLHLRHFNDTFLVHNVRYFHKLLDVLDLVPDHLLVDVMDVIPRYLLDDLTVLDLRNLDGVLAELGLRHLDDALLELHNGHKNLFRDLLDLIPGHLPLHVLVHDFRNRDELLLDCDKGYFDVALLDLDHGPFDRPLHHLGDGLWYLTYQLDAVHFWHLD